MHGSASTWGCLNTDFQNLKWHKIGSVEQRRYEIEICHSDESIRSEYPYELLVIASQPLTHRELVWSLNISGICQ